MYREVYPETLTAVVLKAGAPRLAEAGFTYTEFDLVDPEDPLSEEQRRQVREDLKYAMNILLERLRREDEARS